MNDEEKKARLAEKLRENLRRRKAQARGAKAKAKAEAEAAGQGLDVRPESED